jgi:hypothetical protein
VQQPPAQAQVPSIRLKVVAIRLLKVVVVIVLEVDARAFAGGLGRRERDDGGEVVAAAEQVQLDACEEGQEGEGVDEGKGASYCWDC